MNIVRIAEQNDNWSEIMVAWIVFQLCYILVRVSLTLLGSKRLEIKQEAKYFLGMCYVNLLLASALTPIELTLKWSSIAPRIAFVPFDTIIGHWPMGGEYAVAELLGTLLMFLLMLPVLAYCFKVRALPQAIIFTTFLLVIIEGMQLIVTTTRYFDTDDIIVGLIAFVLSIGVWKIIQSVRVPR